MLKSGCLDGAWGICEKSVRINVIHTDVADLIEVAELQSQPVDGLSPVQIPSNRSLDGLGYANLFSNVGDNS